MTYVSFYIIMLSLVECAVYFYFVFTILNNIYLSLIILFTLLILKYMNKNILINKQKFYSGEFDMFLLKPVNSLIVTLIYGLSVIDSLILIVIIIITIILYLKYLLLTVSLLIIMISLYLISRSLLIKYSNYQFIEKIPQLSILTIFSLLYRPLQNTEFNFVVQLSILSFSSFVFYLSIKLWQKTLIKYIKQ